MKRNKGFISKAESFYLKGHKSTRHQANETPRVHKKCMTGVSERRHPHRKFIWEGYTLLEIMVVLFILSLILSFITININVYRNEKIKAVSFANVLLSKMKLAKQQSILQHTNLRWIANSKRYVFQKRVFNQQSYDWQELTEDPLLSAIAIEPSIIIKNTSSIDFYPNGDFTPFEMNIFLKDSTTCIVSVIGHQSQMEIIEHEK